MRFFAILFGTLTAVSLVSISQTHAQGAKSWSSANTHRGKARVQPRRSRRFSQAEIDRLPVRVTRPDNSANLVFDGVPLWAARAFQPARRR
ncbi:MAG: hypothetical protein AAFR55_07330 [Pseudomonadota bacterium]